MNPVAEQVFPQYLDERRQRLADLVVEFRPGQPYLAAMSGHVDEQGCHRTARQTFLRVSAFGPKPVQCSDRGRSRHVRRPGDGQIGDHV